MKRFMAGLVLIAAVATSGPSRASEVPVDPEPSTFASVDRFRTEDGTRVYLFFDRGVPSVVNPGNLCVGAVRKRLVGVIRTVRFESGCLANAPLDGDMQNGTATLDVVVETMVAVFREVRTAEGWRTTSERYRSGRATATLRWQGGEPRYEPGLGWYRVPMYPTYGSFPAPYPRVSKVYDALVNGVVVMRGLDARISIDDRPGRLAFSLPF